jgi:purine-binding chemotaxis protein CheW
MPLLFEVSPYTESEDLLIFGLDHSFYALRISAVREIVRMVAITPLPRAMTIVQGIINVRGSIVPVLRMRERFGLPARGVRLNDHLILARTSRQMVALAVDRVLGVTRRSAEEMTRPERILAGLDYVEGVVKLEDGLAYIHDLDTFLSLDEEAALDQAMPPWEGP